MPESEEMPIDPAALKLIEDGKAANRQEAEAMLKKLEDVAEEEGGEVEEDDVGDDEDEAAE